MNNTCTNTGEYTQLPGLRTRSHRFDVPLDYSKPDGSTISIFAREVVAPEKQNNDLPWLVFFQGGPGFGSPRPNGPDNWIKRAIQDYRVLLLDQRGTGLSTTVSAETLQPLGGAQAQADYLKHFRADNIVRDAEYIRKQLTGGKQWTGLGQSFGGFCMTTYLSLAPEGLSAAILTGGLPPLTDDPDEVYRRTYIRVISKNQSYYERYPQDATIARRVVDHLSENEVVLPTGEKLTAERFLQLGISFGMSDGWEGVHYLLEYAFAGNQRTLSYQFLSKFAAMQDFNAAPIYSLLHEAIYCQNRASRWSAHRLLAEFPQFNGNHETPLFTGEMIYPWMFDQYSQLRSLKDAANILADYAGWGILYNRAVLRQNRVPTVAAVYFDDMYVDLGLSLETAKEIKGIKTWITNQYEHNGIRADGCGILDRLLGMLRGTC